MTQLLCTFAKKNKISETIEEIKKTYDISFNRIYILENKDNSRELLCTYNVDREKIYGKTMRNTISIHRRKQSNTLFTINALNYIVSLFNDGKMDDKFEIDWNRFKNTLLVSDDKNGYREILTKVYKIINF